MVSDTTDAHAKLYLNRITGSGDKGEELDKVEWGALNLWLTESCEGTLKYCRPNPSNWGTRRWGLSRSCCVTVQIV